VQGEGSRITCAGLGVGHDPSEDRRTSLEAGPFYETLRRLLLTIPSLAITNAGAPIFGKANVLDRPKFPKRKALMANDLRPSRALLAR